jgi:glycerol uptake facilitator-like aquaporin
VIGLLAAIYFGGHISGGHFNPAVTTMMLAKGDITLERFIAYVSAQVLGALAALLWWQSTPRRANV